jgi:RNA polymerase sigma-70 factor (ECF subfamily)
MREWLDFAPEEISTELDVSPGNLRVLLYRARMQLRLCLDTGWGRA